MRAASHPAVLFVGPTSSCRDRVEAALVDVTTVEAVGTWLEAETRLSAAVDWVVVVEEPALPTPERLAKVGLQHAVMALVREGGAYPTLAAHGVTDVLDADTFSGASLRATYHFAAARSGAQAPIAARFRSLVQAVPDIIARIDDEGNVRDVHIPDEFVTAVSPTIERRIDLDRSLGAETMQRVLDACQESLATGQRQRVFYQTHVDGQIRHREAICVAIAERDFLILVRDTTALVEAQAERDRSANELVLRSELLRQIAQNAPIVFFSLDRTGRFVQVEGRGLDGIGLTPDELVGQSALELYSSTHPRIVRAVRSALAGERVSVLIDFGGHAFETAYTPLRDANGAVSRVVGVATDVTERVAARTELEQSRLALRELAGHLQSVREEERRRISREVHDVLGQALTALRLRVGWLAQRLPTDNPEVSRRVADTESLIDETIQHVRQIATRLRPGVLDDFGLVSAMEWQAEQFTAQAEVPAHFTTSPGIDEANIPSEVATALFRILQEALTNIARHANATSVEIFLRRNGERLRLTVRDDGVGLSLGSKKRSLGVLGMRERALILGGHFTIEGVDGDGTTLVAEVPLEPAPKEERLAPDAEASVGSN
ncbi:MAG: histidine kinase [Bacteroidota bacterium]